MTAYEATLAVLLRYYLATTRTLHAGALSDYSLKSVEKALADLQREKLVQSHQFDGRTLVYGLTPRAAQLHGLHPKRFRRPPGIDPIFENLLMLQFCTCGPIKRKRMTPKEFTRDFPELAAAKGVTKTRYYLDRSAEQPRLAVIVPDFGATYYRMAKKARAALQKRLEHIPFRDHVYNRLFLVTVLTGFASQADEIRRALASHQFDYAFAVEVVPGFGDLLAQGDPRE